MIKFGGDPDHGSGCGSRYWSGCGSG